MKAGRKLLSMMLFGIVILSLIGLTGCSSKGSSGSSEVKVYTNETKLNSDVINVWTSFYLLDEDTYLFTVYAVDSKDNTKVTADLSMKGQYTLDGDQLKIDLGYGYVVAMNGDTPVEMAITADNAAMYYAMIGGQYTSFTLEKDGTFEIVE